VIDVLARSGFSAQKFEASVAYVCHEMKTRRNPKGLSGYYNNNGPGGAHLNISQKISRQDSGQR